MPRWSRNSIVGVIAIGLLLVAAVGTMVHWDGWPPVAVTMQLVDAETGAPLDHATVSVVVHRASLEKPDFADWVRYSLEHQAPDDPQGGGGLRIHSRRANGEPELTIHSIAIIGGVDVLGMTVHSERHLPSLVVIDHDRYGRTMFPSPKTYRSASGTNRSPTLWISGRSAFRGDVDRARERPRGARRQMPPIRGTTAAIR